MNIAIQPIIRGSNFGVVTSVIVFFLSSCRPADVAQVDRINPTHIEAAGGPSPSPVPVTISGFNLANCDTAVFDEGFDEGVSGNVTSAAAGDVTMTVTARQDTELGNHTLSLSCGVNGAVEISLLIGCPNSISCPPLPELSTINPAPGSNFPSQGHTSQVRFYGRNFQNLSPVIELDPAQGSGLIINPSTPATVSRDGSMDYFDLFLSVALSASTGDHRMRVRTTGGRTDWEKIVVKDQYGRLPPPIGIPLLTEVTPDKELQPDTDVFIECHGRGFGVNREVVLSPVQPQGGPTPSPIPVYTYSVVNPAQADPDTVVVAKIHPLESGYIRVSVKNVDLNITSDDINVYVTEPYPEYGDIIAKNTATGGVQRGGTYTLQVTGQNLADITDSSWLAGSGDLSFSNTNATSTTASVTVTAGPFAAVTGDSATNVYLTDGNKKSGPFTLNVLP